jgi:pyruvate,orthophosphate dikinase
VEQGIFAKDPFQTLDTQGVGALVEIAKDRGREDAPGPQARHLRRARRRSRFHPLLRNAVGLDYVSCSPFRVPIARLAAAQAALASDRAPSTTA